MVCGNENLCEGKPENWPAAVALAGPAEFGIEVGGACWVVLIGIGVIISPENLFVLGPLPFRFLLGPEDDPSGEAGLDRFFGVSVADVFFEGNLEE